jgi:hypothetical protein
VSNNNQEKMMNTALRLVLAVVFAMTLAACSSKPKPTPQEGVTAPDESAGVVTTPIYDGDAFLAGLLANVLRFRPVCRLRNYNVAAHAAVKRRSGTQVTPKAERRT